MKQLFEELQRCLKEGNPSVLVTIVDSSGSTPRGAGSRMLVTREGIRRGTIGGGAVEHRAMEIAMEALEKQESFIQSFSLTRNQTADLGMVCGGDVRLYFQYVSAEDARMEELCARILEAMEQDRDSWLIVEMTDVSAWHMGLLQNGSCFGLDFPPLGPKAGQIQLEGRTFYTEPLVQAGTVYIFGGGHVAQELVPLLAHLNFRCVVMDDRAEFANPQVFPQAVRTIAGNLERIFDYVQITGRDYVCIMTRGHQYDYYVQKQVLPLKPRYIGIMGSHNKIRVTTDKLLADGFSPEEIRSCHMPIGTDILAQTPAEIAVSVAGELIFVRAGGEEKS